MIEVLTRIVEVALVVMIYRTVVDAVREARKNAEN